MTWLGEQVFSIVWLTELYHSAQASIKYFLICATAYLSVNRENGNTQGHNNNLYFLFEFQLLEHSHFGHFLKVHDSIYNIA